MGNIATYNAKMLAKVNIAGNEEIKIPNGYKFQLNFSNPKEALRKEIARIGVDFGGLSYNDEFFDLDEVDNFIDNYLEDISFVTLYKDHLQVDTNIFQLVKEVNLEYIIRDGYVIFELGYTWNPIYCGTDNWSKSDIDKNNLKRILNIIPDDKLELCIEGDGYGSNC